MLIVYSGDFNSSGGVGLADLLVETLIFLKEIWLVTAEMCAVLQPQQDSRVAPLKTNEILTLFLPMPLTPMKY